MTVVHSRPSRRSRAAQQDRIEELELENFRLRLRSEVMLGIIVGQAEELDAAEKAYDHLTDQA